MIKKHDMPTSPQRDRTICGFSADELASFLLGTAPPDLASKIANEATRNDELASWLEVLDCSSDDRNLNGHPVESNDIFFPVLPFDDLPSTSPHDYVPVTSVGEYHDDVAKDHKRLVAEWTEAATLDASGDLRAARIHFTRVARYCCAAIRSEILAGHRPSTQVAEHWIASLFRSRDYDGCAAAIALLRSITLPDATMNRLKAADRQVATARRIFAFFTDVARRVEQRATWKIRSILTDITEQLRATSSWLYVPSGELFIPLAEINGGIRRELHLGEGIVGVVAATLAHYYAPEIARDAHESIQSNRSGYAIPILDGDSSLLGVLHLESSRVDGFSPAQRWELDSLATAFVADLLILKNDKSGPAEKAGWKFDRQGWGLADVLSELCLHVCDVLGDDGPRPACAIWHCDHTKSELWVRATDGYDAEFIKRRHLSDEHRSLVGRMVRSPLGSVFADHWRNASEFAERDKAERMGLGQVHVCPLYEPDNDVACGTLNVYYFDKHRLIPRSLLLHIADSVGELIASHRRLQSRVAAAKLEHRLAHEKSLSVGESFALALRLLLDSMAADAGSLFAGDEASGVLECVATSGLEKEGRPVYDLRGACYDINHDDGVTVFLAKNPGVCVRKNDICDKCEPAAVMDNTVVRLSPLNKYRETMALSAIDHRRLLGIGVRSARTDNTVLIARLLRAPHSRPFLESDECLLRRLMEPIQKICEEWVKERSLDLYVQSARDRLLCGEGKPSGERERSFGRLIHPASARSGNRILVGEVLQNALVYFNHYGALLTNLREVVIDERGNEQFRVFAFHSTRSRRDPDPRIFPQASRSEGNIGWKSIEAGKLLTFERQPDEGLFHPIHEDSKDVRSGACVPFVSWTAERCVKWVFALDCADVARWTPQDIEVLLHIARKLSAVLSDGNRPVVLPSQLLLKGFVASGVRAACADWGILNLNVKDRETEENQPKIVATFGDIIRGPGKWESASGQAGRLGVKVRGNDAAACKIPLLFGPYAAGHLTCGSCSQSYSDMDQVGVGEIVRLWSSLAGFPGLGAFPSWESTFTKRLYDEKSKEIQQWEAVPMYCVSSDESELFARPLLAAASDGEMLGNLIRP